MISRTQIVHLLTSHRLPLADEKALQVEIAAILACAGMAFQREFRLDRGDIVDFMVGELAPIEAGIAIEVKVKGGRRDIFKQLERYCGHKAVREIVLVTNVPMALPVEINGKPTAIAQLGRGWL
jgi:hypothetical protein